MRRRLHRQLREERDDGKGYGRESTFGMVGTGRNICWQVPIINNAAGSPNTFCALFSGDSCAVPRTAATVALMGGYPVSDFGQFANEQMMDYPDFTVPGTILIWGAIRVPTPIASRASITDAMKRDRSSWSSTRRSTDVRRRQRCVSKSDPVPTRRSRWLGTTSSWTFTTTTVEKWCYGFDEWRALLGVDA